MCVLPTFYAVVHAFGLVFRVFIIPPITDRHSRNNADGIILLDEASARSPPAALDGK